MGEQETLNSLAKAVEEYDKDKAMELAKKALKEGIDPIKALEEGLGKGIREVGEKFQRMEVYLPHLVMAAEAMQAASNVLTAGLSKEEAEEAVAGVVVLGTVKGDIHDLDNVRDRGHAVALGVAVAITRAGRLRRHSLRKQNHVGEGNR